MGWVDSSKGWNPQKVVNPCRAIASIVSQPGTQKTQSPANASLAVGDEAPGSSSPYSGALCASRTAAPCIGEVSCIQLPEVPPTKYGENPLVQARQCVTVHSPVRGSVGSHLCTVNRK
jgi:hypothetical protein